MNKYPTVEMGYIHYLELSEEWSHKAMENIVELGRITLTHEPFKMLYRNEEQELWGDDWNDNPADCNSGPPYGGERITLNAGDLVIIVKPTKLDVAIHQIVNLLCEIQSLQGSVKE